MTVPDLFHIDRLLAVEHRADDEPCSCDECMSYGAEDAGVNWFRIPPANRIAMRILDGADERLAVLAKAFRDHDEAVAAELGQDLGPADTVPSGGGPVKPNDYGPELVPRRADA